ncbi:hypothetical protein [Legionella drancourtii]|uniref:Porin n=1 Tax=Legionella drancourtii LLAP12 TaxID=658187 RepID=G9EQT5_9GAMM|nr:hypothetical protein [Legionella drancourtii]EHL30306.1 hypothetical protein LDG_7638 [Legionella drancourtii LLAP12]
MGKEVLRSTVLMVASITTAHALEGDFKGFKYAFHGFISATGYTQTTPGFVLNGQGPLILLFTPSTSSTTTGFDVRQTRLTFSASGPSVMGGATPKGLIEIDFFGLNSPGGYGEVSVYPRLRLAYTELDWYGRNKIRAGQDWELLMVDLPTSLSHLAYPVTYFAGLVGWREPGVSFFHTDTMENSNLEFALQVLKSDWQNPLDFGQSTVQNLNVDAGQLSGLPGIEMRTKWTSANQDYAVYVVGHVSKVDGTRVRNLPISGGIFVTTPTRNWTVAVAKIGGKAKVSAFTLKGEVYTGKNTGPLIGEQLQFITANDVHESGGWIQLGYDLPNNFSIYGTYGIAADNKSDVVSGGGVRYQNQVYGGMIQYRSKTFAVGPEIYHVTTSTVSGSPLQGITYLLSANYGF